MSEYLEQMRNHRARANNQQAIDKGGSSNSLYLFDLTNSSDLTNDNNNVEYGEHNNNNNNFE